LEVSLPLAPDHKPIRFLFLPESDDPDTYVRKHGRDGWRRKLREAETLTQFLLAQLKSECDLASAEGRARFISVAKPHVQKVTAPALRLQLINEIAQLARVGEGEIDRLLELPQRARFSRPAPARTRYAGPDSPEWSLLYSLLCNLALLEHIDPDTLNLERPESQALLAIREACRQFDDEPSLGLLFERLEGSQWLELVLRAHKYGEEIRFSAEEAETEFTEALGKLDLARRRKELDQLRAGGLASPEALRAWQEKNMEYKRLQGALPSP
jgi:DNA primase